MTHRENRQEMLVERRVTYALEIDGCFFLIENVPARVNMNTCEQIFSPQTVEQIQRTIHGGEKPVRVVQTPVYQFAG